MKGHNYRNNIFCQNTRCLYKFSVEKNKRKKIRVKRQSEKTCDTLTIPQNHTFPIKEKTKKKEEKKHHMPTKRHSCPCNTNPGTRGGQPIHRGVPGATELWAKGCVAGAAMLRKNMKLLFVVCCLMKMWWGRVEVGDWCVVGRHHTVWWYGGGAMVGGTIVAMYHHDCGGQPYCIGGGAAWRHLRIMSQNEIFLKFMTTGECAKLFLS